MPSVDIPSLLTRHEVIDITGYSIASIYRLMRAGHFPEPIKIGPRSIRWKAEEIAAYIEDRPRANGQEKVNALKKNPGSSGGNPTGIFQGSD